MAISTTTATCTVANSSNISNSNQTISVSNIATGTITLNTYGNGYYTGTPYNNNWSTTTVTPAYYDYQDYVQDLVKKYTKEINVEKEKDNMSNSNFNFGAYSTNDIRMSIYGMAIKNKSGKWVSYDKKTKRLMDVDIFNFDIDSGKIFYKIPRAIDDVIPGDIILHNDKPVFVEHVRPDGKFDVINPYEGEAIAILPPTSPFGFNYVLAIVSLMDALPEASSKNPFGKFLPFLLSGNDNNGLLAMMMMKDDLDDMDPLLMMALCGKGDMSAFLFMKMMQGKKKKKSKGTFYKHPSGMNNIEYADVHISEFDDALGHARLSEDMDE